MSMTVSVRIEHAKANKTNGQRRHDLRIGRQPGYVDRDQQYKNSLLIEPLTASRLREICQERRSKRVKAAMKQDPNIVVSGIITFGTDAQPVIEALTRHQQDSLFKKTADRVAEELNTTVTGLVVHRDESAIHAHFQMPQYRMDGEQVKQHTTPTALKHLQDIAGEVFGPLGIARGVSKQERIKNRDSVSSLVHRSVRQLHNDLPKEIEAAQKKLEKNQELVLKTAQKLAEGAGNLEKMKNLLKTYEKRVDDAQGFLARHPMPSTLKIEFVDEKKKRLFGLLPDKLKISKGRVIAAKTFDKWVHGFAEEQACKERNIAEREAEAEKRSKSMEQRESVLKSKSDELAKLSDELHGMGRGLADNQKCLGALGMG